MIDIPQEIWLKILEYLSIPEAGRLLSVNRPLFNIVMNRRYRNVQIGPVSGKVSRSVLLHWESIAPRVRSLSIQTNETRALSRAKACFLHSLCLLKKLGAYLIPDDMMILPPFCPAAIPSKDLLRLMDHFTLVHEFKLDGLDINNETCHYAASLYSPLVKKAFDVFGSNLVSLEITLSVGAFHRYFDPLNVFPMLQHFILHLAEGKTLEATQTDISSSILPTLNRHRDTLRSLSMDAWKNVEPSVLLHGLDYMPLLSSFGLTTTYDPSCNYALLAGLHAFLVRQGSTINALKLEFFAVDSIPDYNTWFWEPCFGTPLPLLKSLTIRLYDFPETFIESLSTYVSQFKATLDTLILKGEPLNEDKKRGVRGRYGYATTSSSMAVPRFSIQQAEQLGEMLSITSPNHIRDLQLEMQSLHADLYVPPLQYYPQIKTFSARFHYVLVGTDVMGSGKEEASFSYIRYY
ncbi:hypothetical protein CPC08DRAFT_166131 [Agrocybe pediades]|nr:hypothetical protein CPC08DRAFT_166131 [Agrocybe pediades]